MKKCCWIRGEDKEKKCPFGLAITLSCHNAGDSVTHMCPLDAVPEDKKERVELANKRIYIYHKTGKCLYAINIMDEAQAVNCNFLDNAQGMGGEGTAFSGSPLYTQSFAGGNLDGLYAFPMGFYSDSGESRNLFQGLFSLLGAHAPEIIKIAIMDQESVLWEKLKEGQPLTEQERLNLENVIETCRQDFEASRGDAAKARELADKWNSRLRAR